jgi:ABC-2 type transport system ATP-binding protein
MDNILEINGLYKKYPEFLLKNVSFSLPYGRIMGFVGQNGAGKTTTIKSILGMTRATSGEIKIFGKDPATLKERIGVVMDSPYYVGEWTVAEVEKAVEPFYKSWDGALFAKTLKKFDVSQTKKVEQLSRGMKVKLMMSVALSHGAELLILDEPTSGLDPVARDELIEILADLRRDGKGVLFSTHITADVERVADYVTFIRNGEIVYTGQKIGLSQSYRSVKVPRISENLKKQVIGGRDFEGFFEGLVLTKDADAFGEYAVPATLDEIIIYLSREGRKNA